MATVLQPDSKHRPLATSGWSGFTDRVFRSLTALFGFLVVAIIVWIGFRLYQQSALTRGRFGWGFLTQSTWDVPHEVYGALPFIFGSVVSAAIALVIAVPIGVGAAVFLAEFAPKRLAAVLSFLIELLAAVPSVIFGLWAFLVLCPWMQAHVNPWLVDHFGSLPLLAGPPIMTNMLSAGLILAIMVLPFITSVSREVIRMVPSNQREASLGLGATRWETVRSVVLPSARSGIAGAVMLALGRAIGETMAVVMVIGNDPHISTSLLKPGYSMPALLANQFNEAFSDDVQLSALLEIALILFAVTLLINIFARLLILYMARQTGGHAQRPGREGSTRLWETAGRTLKSGVYAVAAAGIALWVIRDVQARGLRGLIGPVELVLLAIVATRAITSLCRGTPGWRRWREVNSLFSRLVLAIFAVLACVALGLVLGYVTIQGWKAFHLNLITQLPRPPGEPGGGIKNAIVGTLLLVGIAAAMGVPIGLMGGIYLAEFGSARMAAAIRFSADVLNGIPSVVIGMFAYAAFVLPVKHFSAAAGGAALGIMMVPIVIRTTEEVLRLVPTSLREASLGLGASKARTIMSVVLPAARGGVITGILLSTARIMGETAPLLFTAFGSDEMTTKLSQPISSMTMKIYQYAISPYQDWIDTAWAGALLLVVLIFFISLATRWATRGQLAVR